MTTEVYHSEQPSDLVPRMPSEHLLPVPDNTVKTLFYWAMDLDISQGARIVLLTIVRHVEWIDGTGCKASIPTLAREAHQTQKTTKGHIKALIDAGLISRKRHFSKASETLLATSTVGVETTPTVGVETTPTVGVAATPLTNSSSSLSNQSKKPKKTESKKQETKTNKTSEEEKRRPGRRVRPKGRGPWLMPKRLMHGWKRTCHQRRWSASPRRC